MELKTDELDLTSAESKATYDEIKAYVKEHSGLTVSSLNIAQVKQKYGIIERENYNKAKTEDSRQPKCTEEKEEVIVEALKFFRMIKLVLPDSDVFWQSGELGRFFSSTYRKSDKFLL